MDLAEDLHVHSTFSDGCSSLEANVAEAERMGLARLGCVDHVRRDTCWVREYARAVGAAAASTHVTMSAGIEAKILDRAGALDLPADFREADFLYAADHQFPWDDGPRSPHEMRAQIADGRLASLEAIDRLIEATMGTMRRYAEHPLVLAHLFSILPKIGVDEVLVPLQSIRALGAVAAETGTVVEVSERWRCPSIDAARELRAAGVRLVSSTDSHRADTIGRYSYVTDVARAIDV
jgi:putative hydrolase